MRIFTSDDLEQLAFAREAAAHFAENPDNHTYTTGHIKHGELFAVRWGHEGRAVLVIEAHNPCAFSEDALSAPGPGQRPGERYCVIDAGGDFWRRGKLDEVYKKVCEPRAGGPHWMNEEAARGLVEALYRPATVVSESEYYRQRSGVQG